MATIGYATLQVVPSLKGAQAAIERDSTPALAAAGKSGGSAFSKGLKAAAMIGIGAAVAGITAIIGTGIGEVMDASAANAQLRAGIKSTGNAAHVTVKGMNALASSIQSYSGQTDDSIAASQKLLLTFTNIQNRGPNKIFDLATKATADMAAKMGGDASGSAIQLGKALNDPIKGVGALSRVGVSFTEGQKKSIAQMVKNGNVMGAQKVILKELNKEFGGAAKAAGDSLPGKLQRAKRAFEDISQTIVGALIPIVMPALQGIASVVTEKIIPAVNGFVKGFKKGTGAGGQFRDILTRVGEVLQSVGSFLLEHKQLLFIAAGAVAGVVIGLKIYNGVMVVIRAATAAWAAVQAVLNAVMAANPIGIIIVAVAALAAAIVAAYFKFDTFRALIDTVWQGIQVVVEAVVGFFQTKVMPVLAFVVDAIVGYFKFLWTVYQPVWNAIYAIAEKVISWFVVTAWPKIKMFIDLFVLGIKDLWAKVEPVWNLIKAGAEVVINWFTRTAWPAIQTFVQYITASFQAGWPVVVGAWDKIYSKVETIVGWFTDTALPAIRGFVTNVVNTFTRIVTFVSGIPGAITTAIGNLGSLLYNAGAAVIEGFLNGIKSGWGKVTGWLGDQVGKIPGLVSGVLGINSPAKVMIPIGAAIPEGLEVGMRGKMPSTAALSLTIGRDVVSAFVKGMGEKDQDAREAARKAMVDSVQSAYMETLGKLRDGVATIKGEMRDFAKSVSDSIMGVFNFGDAFAQVGTEGGVSFMDALRLQAEQAKVFADRVRELVQAGLSQAALQQVLSAGVVAGTGIANSLISGGSAAITETNDLVASAQGAADKVGLLAGTNYYGAGLASAKQMVAGMVGHFGPEGPGRERLMTLMDNLAASMDRTATITITTRTINAGYDAARANGGPVWPGGTFLVGENGPELFRPKAAGEIVPHGSLDMASPATRRAAVQGSAHQPVAINLSIGGKVIDERIDARIEYADGTSLDYTNAGERL